MRFRDLSSFNQALVAKQGWRILHNSESLMAKTLKAKYFKRIDFIEAKLGSNPSFVWRSIIWGRQLLHDGLRWRNGNGTQVPIYSRNWIQNAVVADLIKECQ